MARTSFFSLVILLLLSLLSCSPSAPSKTDCEHLLASTLAGHSTANLTVTSIKPFALQKDSYIVTISFTLTPPKGRPHSYNNAQTVISWDYARHTWADTAPENNPILATIKDYEYTEALAASAKNEKVYPNPWNHPQTK